jgi:hypothetical protein
MIFRPHRTFWSRAGVSLFHDTVIADHGKVNTDLQVTDYLPYIGGCGTTS